MRAKYLREAGREMVEVLEQEKVSKQVQEWVRA